MLLTVFVPDLSVFPGDNCVGHELNWDSYCKGTPDRVRIFPYGCGKIYCGAKRLIFSGSRKNSSPVFLAQASYLMGVPKKFFERQRVGRSPKRTRRLFWSLC